MKVLLSIFGILTLLISSSANLNAQSLTAVFSAQVEEDEIDGFTPAATPEDPEPEAVIDQAFFNVKEMMTVSPSTRWLTSTLAQLVKFLQSPVSHWTWDNRTLSSALMGDWSSF